jgi:hypothetical protein
VREFQKSSRIDWTVRHTRPNVKKYAFLKNWNCSHSDHNKSNLNRMDEKAKAKGCKATLQILVKWDSVWTRKTDAYCKRGLILFLFYIFFEFIKFK